MTKLKTLCASGALLLGSSTLALAQLITSPPGGSHPEMATPQNAPDSWAAGAGTDATTAPSAVTPSTQLAAVELADQRLVSVIKRQVENAGYSSVYGITPSLDGYTARAMESGQRVTVDIDGYGNVYRVPNQH
jgi:membrane-bound ClpP family serine protease